jgi:hypothetical protein
VPARSRSVGGSLSPSRAIRPQIQIGKPSLPEHGAIASQAGDGDGEGLLQTSKTGEGRAPVRSCELESGDGGTAAVPADDLPGEGVGLDRPGDSQLITRRANNAEGILTRASGPAPGGPGSASRPVTAGCWLTVHADASDPSDDPSFREPVRRLKQLSAVFDTEETHAAPGQAAVHNRTNRATDFHSRGPPALPCPDLASVTPATRRRAPDAAMSHLLGCAGVDERYEWPALAASA